MRRELLFVSTRFLFPVDSGGKIRTVQILRGMKNGAFKVVLASPATEELVREHVEDLREVCDDFHWWPQPKRGVMFHYLRLRHILSPLPIPVRTDVDQSACALVARLLERNPAVAVFDFAHAAVLAPARLSCPSVLFTHNVEAEIFWRHKQVAKTPLSKSLWWNQHRKMERFEASALKRFDAVVAVAERDANAFRERYGVSDAVTIPTGVDLEFFSYKEPDRNRDVVFCGSMDWLANQEAIGYFMKEVWPRVVARAPEVRMTVVGRAPPSWLVSEASRRGFDWHFTGYVDDVREYVWGALSVLPLRIGGGTRLKVYEAMALGSPLVSTAIGVEGLPVRAGQHYVRADSAEVMANAIVDLLQDDERRMALSRRARRFVEEHCSFQEAAKAFEKVCESVVRRRRAA